MSRVFASRRTFLSMTAGAAALCLARRGSVWAQSTPKDDPTRLTLHEAAAYLCRRDLSPVELTKACLRRIEQYDSRINAFITVTSRLALEQARSAEKEIRGGRWRGPLHGIPIAFKDVIDTAGIRTTAARADLVDRIPTQDAEVVGRLRRAGAVVLGKLNLGMWSGGHWGPVHNPWALDHEAGYSSSGPGAAVAAGFCLGALGTDIGGSIRIPASACAVVGLKPTYGLVSNRGVITDNDSQDHVGPLCKTTLDAALLLQAIAGYDPNWSRSARVEPPDYVAGIRERLRPHRVGIAGAGFFEGLDSEVARLTDAALKTMSTLATISRHYVEVPGYRDSLRDILEGRCAEGVAPAVLHQARQDAARIFKDEVDLLVMPTWKRLPMTFEARQKASPLPVQDFEQELWNTRPFNVLGLPAISVPCGFTQSGLPVGVQIVGRPFCEVQILSFAHAYEQTTSWHSRRPKL